MNIKIYLLLNTNYICQIELVLETKTEYKKFANQ